MESNLVVEKGTSKPIVADLLLKATSLLYLKDALEGERYEECFDLIQNAKSFGAAPREISDVIVRYVKKLTAGEAFSKKGRRFS